MGQCSYEWKYWRCSGNDSRSHDRSHFHHDTCCDANHDCYVYLHRIYNDFHLNNDFHQYDYISEFQLYVNQESDADQHDHIILLHRDRYEQHRPNSDHHLHYNPDFNLNYHISLNNHCR
jgi:hypothetical protein